MTKRRPPFALFMLLCIALAAWFFAQATFSLLRERPADALRNGLTAPGRNDAAPEPLAAFEDIASRNLFGVAVLPPESRRNRKGAAADAEDEDSAAQNADALPISKKKWKLYGTIVDNAADKGSRAIIEIEGKERAYREGEAIQGWKIALVQRRAVVLAKGGARERLIMSDDAAQASAVKIDVRKTVSRTRLREELGDIGALMRNVSIAPQSVGGYRGLRLLTVQPGSYIEELGLQKDDLLLGANDRPLTGFGDLAGLGEVADKDAVTLEVLRNGKKTIIRYDVQS